MSLAITELHLLPAVRAADPGCIILADGTCCRHQIRDGSGRDAIHVARLLADSMERRERKAMCTASRHGLETRRVPAPDKA